MERQGSFYLKPTRFLAFALLISSSLACISLFSIWAVRLTPPPPSGAPERLNHVSFHSNPAPGRNLTLLNRNHRDSGLRPSIVSHSQFGEPKSVLGYGSDASRLSPERIEEGGVVTANLSAADNPGAFSSVSRGSTKERTAGCDVTRGRWVFDERYPLYAPGSCPFIDEGFNCEGNGRSNRDYMKWRWKPQDCDIPRFNATHMLNVMRGKRLVFVGDSISRNQWESMLCLLRGTGKDSRRVYETHGRRITNDNGNYRFRIAGYGCTVEYYVTHFLVHEGKTRLGRRRVPTLRIDAMDRGTSRWKHADFLVFNTGHWWSHHKTKTGINYYQEGGMLHPHLDVSAAFERALMTWASWVDQHIDAGRTHVFFQSLAPSHYREGQWDSGGHCREATRPINATSLRFTYSGKNVITEEVIQQMRTPVTFLNITRPSDYRVDGHPSVYGRKSGRDRLGVQDCSHWCLPGVPDTWNELLYFHIQSKRRSKLAG